MKVTYSNCIYGHADKHVAGSQSKSAKPACLRALPAGPGKLSGTAGRSCHPRPCPARTPSALRFTLSLPAPTSSPTLSSKSDNVSFSFFFHPHDTQWGRYFKEIIKWMNSCKSKLKPEALFPDLPTGRASWASSYFSDVLHGFPAHGFLADWAGAEARGRASAAPGAGLPCFSRPSECSTEEAELSLFSSILCSFSCL